jgi:signal transduction histidine kinase
VERARILIITDENDFLGALTASWARERNMPVLVRKSAAECAVEKFDLAIVGALYGPPNSALDALRETGKPVIYLSRVNGDLPKASGVVSLPEVPGWPALVITVADQILERERALAEVTKLQEANSRLERHEQLGQYMTDMRHNYNNALTSILGNCDLILLDAHQLSSTTKAQVETIRNMAMRLNEVLQRFSSLQKEMQLLEQQRKAVAKGATAGA